MVNSKQRAPMKRVRRASEDTVRMMSSTYRTMYVVPSVLLRIKREVSDLEHEKPMVPRRQNECTKRVVPV